MQQPLLSKRILIEGLTPDEILTLPDEHIAALIAVGPVVFSAGSAEILAQIRLRSGALIVELAQIDGGGEGVLPVLSRLAERFARQRGLDAVEWVVHAINCAHPNLKLRGFLEKRGFEVVNVEGIGPAYYLRQAVGRSPSAI
ncbi:conserved hypothetical protein [Bradyrhizobium sp. ORS 375]|uniref:hypothetical protein n=1 Tax=Bradyrhizobium sp. (strain ORS 375) TaxID=566679 RepID=UPI000240A742|nr:hypothetical protein [Bradyrhizobium sp. ORS 375]CCD92879.1 conserved hypothetical protein [Bradyrhizobium sp. ORS 375]